ncbi:MAG: PLDc N-terminal domain-containing protein [Verrucomicrobiota bacterium]
MENYTLLIIVIVLMQLLWVWTLVSHLKSEEIESTDKICWTVVLCVLNLFGLLLYLVFGPKGEQILKSEEDLKRAINEGRR